MPQAAKREQREQIPKPYVLEVPWTPEGSTLLPSVRLTLIGGAVSLLSQAVAAFEIGVAQGLRHSEPLTLADVLQEQVLGSGHWMSIRKENGDLEPRGTHGSVSPFPGRIEIEFKTPLRLRIRGKLIRAEDLRLDHLVTSVVRRIALLRRFHCGVESGGDPSPAMDRGAEVAESDDLRWTEWTRYSSRQSRAIRMGGILGSLTVNTKGLERIWPYLWWGQWIHAGKGAGMGLGCYRITANPETSSI